MDSEQLRSLSYPEMQSYVSYRSAKDQVRAMKTARGFDDPPKEKRRNQSRGRPRKDERKHKKERRPSSRGSNRSNGSRRSSSASAGP